MGTPIRLILLVLLVSAVVLFFRRWSKTKPTGTPEASQAEGDSSRSITTTVPQPDPIDMPSDTRHETEQADYGA